MENKYYSDGVDRVLTLLKDTFGDQFSYFNGELLNVSENYMPCMMVTETASLIDTDATGLDILTETIIIIVVLNKKDDLGGSDDIELTDYRLRKLVQGQDPTTKEYLTDSVLGALRTHFTMSNDTLYQNMQVDFTPNLRGGADAIATQEGYITITIRRLVPVPVRN